MLIAILSGVGCLIVIVVFILVMCYASSRKRYKNQLEQVKLEMTELEDAVKNEATKGTYMKSMDNFVI